MQEPWLTLWVGGYSPGVEICNAVPTATGRFARPGDMLRPSVPMCWSSILQDAAHKSSSTELLRTCP